MLNHVRLYDLMDCSPPDSFIYGIFQAKILERGAISFSRRSFWLRDWTHVPWVSWIGRWILCQLSYQGSPQWQRATCFTKGQSSEVWGDCLEEVGLDYCDARSKGKQATFVENITKGQRTATRNNEEYASCGWQEGVDCSRYGMDQETKELGLSWCQQSLCLLNASAKQKSKTVKNLTVEMSKNKRKFTYTRRKN